MERIKEAKSDAQFPDEVDTPRDVPARVRFQKYRGLKSFRTSPWDKYENLPIEYARIFQFENIKKTLKKLFKESNSDIEVSNREGLNHIITSQLYVNRNFNGICVLAWCICSNSFKKRAYIDSNK